MFRKVILPVFCLNYVLSGVYASEVTEASVSRYLSQHVSKPSSTQVQFDSISSPSSHTIKDVVTIIIPGESVDKLIASERWGKDETLRETFIEGYRKLQSGSLKFIPMEKYPS